MNAEALARTIETGEAHFYSRSRGRLWRKGEESGNVMAVVEMRTDCDQDTVWLSVRMRGGQRACHTGQRSCFYRRIPLGQQRGAGGIRLEAASAPPG
jgi:phosphoribosyl-AMP cyclohydrolase